ncbi:hypothetical protein [Desulfolucanica intricata]|uniref:hypothetical protein n=1 Tax=Desulfolucanica intricata TaxID=1285191 RepID=UPI000831B1B7|nr:hypothetical protein [Desulfolucanica intricata]
MKDSLVDWGKLYKLLEKVTPLPVDCGQLCNSVCCAEWVDGAGMYLYPGEETMFTREENWLIWEEHDASKHKFCPEWEGKLYFIKCFGSCPRSKRPLACRMFPLTPYITIRNELEVRFNVDAWLICPLVKVGDYKLLNKKFISRVKQVWLELLRNPLFFKHVEYRSRKRDSEEKEPWQKFFKG